MGSRQGRKESLDCFVTPQNSRGQVRIDKRPLKPSNRLTGLIRA